MTTDDLIKTIAVDTDMTKAEVALVLESFGDCAHLGLKAGAPVPFPGLGKLVVVPTAARMARNPRTGTPVQVPAARKVKFRASAALKRTLNA